MQYFRVCLNNGSQNPPEALAPTQNDAHIARQERSDAAVAAGEAREERRGEEVVVFAVINVIHSLGPQLYVDTVRLSCCPCVDMVGIGGLPRLNYPTSRRRCVCERGSSAIMVRVTTFLRCLS